MIIELNTKLLDIPGLNSNQLIFLSLVLDKNQKLIIKTSAKLSA